MGLSKNHILNESDLLHLKKDLFRFFQEKDQILENLSSQEDMKKWIYHHISQAQFKGENSVDVKVWSETGRSIVGSNNQELLSRIESLGYCICINKEKTQTRPIPFIRTVFVTISWPNKLDK